MKEECVPFTFVEVHTIQGMPPSSILPVLEDVVLAQIVPLAKHINRADEV